LIYIFHHLCNFFIIDVFTCILLFCNYCQYFNITASENGTGVKPTPNEPATYPIAQTLASFIFLSAYTDAAGRAANYTELYTGDISGRTLTPGVYKWGTGVLINADVTLNGGVKLLWIQA